MNIMSPWKLIDTAPKDGSFIALWNWERLVVDIGQWSAGEWNQIYGEGDMTHWRPLVEGEFVKGPYGYPVWANESADHHHVEGI